MRPNTVSTHGLMVSLLSLLTKRFQGSKVVHSEIRAENTTRLVDALGASNRPKLRM